MNQTSSKGWRRLRRLLVTCAVLATLTAVFYAEENWRGKRDWESYRHALEAQGMVTDWDKLLLPPVPDDQNFFEASPKIQYSFIRARNNAEVDFFAEQPHFQWLITTNWFPITDVRTNGPITVATITLIRKNEDSRAFGSNDLLVVTNDPAARARVNQMLGDALGIMADGSQGFKFSQRDLYHLDGPKIYLVAEGDPSITDLENLVGNPGTDFGHFTIKPVAGDQYQVQLAGIRPFTPAAEYLKWSDHFAPDFDEIRAALKRPYVQLVGDFSNPPEIPIPNFVTMRALAQTLAQRAQCYLMLGQPDQALRELTLMNDSLVILHGAPPARPLTLVAAMIEVAITDVYVSTIAFGLHHHLWPEPQLATLQAQLANASLPPLFSESMNDQPAYEFKVWENATPLSLLSVFSSGILARPVTFWEKLTNRNFLALRFMPHGWVYENLMYSLRQIQKPLAGFDLTNNLVHPQLVKAAWPDIQRGLQHWTPFRIWASIAIPNFDKAMLVVARNQTLANEAQIACALERYHLAHGDYPETLAGLMPQFIEAIPHDLIGGQPLHYRRTADGQFLLYSIGWNETDDNGKISTNRETGDWVWQ